MITAEPIRATVTRYRCPFCRRGRSRRSATAEHMVHCFKNPERVPRVGELTSVDQTGRLRDYGPRPEINGARWLEWNEYDAMPTWWPGEGKIYDGAAWRDVPGHHTEAAEDGHGCAGGAPPVEVWPLLDGVSLAEVPAADRLRILEAT